MISNVPKTEVPRVLDCPEESKNAIPVIGWSATNRSGMIMLSDGPRETPAFRM